MHESISAISKQAQLAGGEHDFHPVCVLRDSSPVLAIVSEIGNHLTACFFDLLSSDPDLRQGVAIGYVPIRKKVNEPAQAAASDNTGYRDSPVVCRASVTHSPIAS